MEAIGIMAIVGMICAIIVLFLIITVVNKVFSFYRRATRDIAPIIKTIQEADQRQLVTPKSLDGTEPVYIPSINRDFPEMNVQLAKTYISNFLPQYFSALSSGDYNIIKDDCSSQFAERVMAVSGTANRVVYSDVKVHKVVVSGYKKNNEEANIIFQAAVQYKASNMNRISQEKYIVTYTYYLDYGAEGENVSLRCKNCGAPISVLGRKTCPYCEAEIVAAISRTWKITDVRKSY